MVDLHDEPGPTQNGTVVAVFPNSEVVLGIKGNLITRMELKKGLFQISTAKGVITPTAELRFPQGGNLFWVDVSKDGAVVVASEGVPMEVVSKKTTKAVIIDFKQQVAVTQEDISEPSVVDQRFKEASKTQELLVQSMGKGVYGEMLKKGTPWEFGKIAKVIEEKSGKKVEYDPRRYEKWLKEEKELAERRLERAVKRELPEFQQQRAVEKTLPKPDHKEMVVDKSVNYSGIDFNVTYLEKGRELKGRNAPLDKDFLVTYIEARNKSPKQVIVFPSEEIGLITEADEIIGLENYSMETNLDPQTETKGFLLFLVGKEDTKFKLQFGKKSLPKVEIEFKL